MKKITKLLLLALALMLALALLASCGGNGEGDGEGNGEGDGESEGSGDGSTEGGGDQGGENTAISKKAWEAAFDFDNATMNVVESVYYATTLYQSESYNTYFANGEGYDKYGLSQGSVAENVFYFAFKESFDSFKHNPTTDEYTCASITIDEFLYEDVVVKFTVDGKLSSICFSYLYYYYYTMKTTVTFTDHEVTVRPEKKEYCSLLDTRDIDGHDLAYITIKVKDYGDIKLVLDATTAPITVKHILKLISEGFYDGLTFHRVIEKFMIQGGDPDANGTGGYKDQDGDKITIKGEFSANGIENDIQHLRGVISMARGSGYNTASSQFFICNADSTHLDENYAAFGYVIDGLSIVDQITEDTKSYGDSNGGIADKDKQVIIESIVVDELVGIKLDGTEGDTEYTGINKADWKAAFEFNNVTMIATERYYSNGVVAEEYVSNVYFVDGVAYDSDGIDRGEISAYRPYFAFVDNFYEFEFDPATSKYT